MTPSAATAAIVLGQTATVVGVPQWQGSGVATVGVKDVPDAVATGKVYIHIDLDVLDPEVFGAVGCPEPGGLSVDELADAVRSVWGSWSSCPAPPPM